MGGNSNGNYIKMESTGTDDRSAANCNPNRFLLHRAIDIMEMNWQ